MHQEKDVHFAISIKHSDKLQDEFIVLMPTYRHVTLSLVDFQRALRGLLQVMYPYARVEVTLTELFSVEFVRIAEEDDNLPLPPTAKH